MTKLFLIRHAEAEGNVFRRLHGQYNSTVTPNGMRQIEALRRRFESIPIDAVYASDLVRTCTTAGAIYKPKALPLRKDARFREICVGAWENIPFGELDYRDHERNFAFSHSPQSWTVEGSEPYAVYTARFLQGLEEVARRHDGQSIAIFSHGMVLRGSLSKLFFPNDNCPVKHAENTAVSLLHWENGSYCYEFINDASHITQEISTLGKQQWWRGAGCHDFNLRYTDAAAENTPLLHALGITPLPGTAVRIAYLVQEPVGALVVRRENADCGALDFFGLLPEHRRRGLSAQLLGEAISILRECGCKTMRIVSEVTAPAARHLLEQYGICGNPPVFDLIPKIK